MKSLKIFVLTLVALMVLLFGKAACAQEACTSGTCVDNEDLKAFVQLAKDQKCRQTTAPTLTMDPITIVIDRDGRVYGSGADPKPYKVNIHWCNYDIDGKGTVQLTAAQHIDRDWGFRFRPKFAAGLFVLDALNASNWTSGVDVAFMADLAYYKQFNFNVHTGLRGAGVSLGIDITRNFGAYAGYGLSWSTWQSNPTAGLYFSF